MADQLCTTAQVKARDEIVDAADDAVLSELIDQVTDFIQEFTGRKLVPEAGATYVVDTGAGSTIHVARGIRAVTSLGIASSDQPETGGTYTAVAAGDILLRPSSIDRKPGWPATRILLKGSSVGRLAAVLNGAQIVGDFGFAAVPPEIQAIAIDAVVAAFNARTSGASEVIGADQVASVPWSRFFADGTPQLRTLQRFRAGYSMGIG